VAAARERVRLAVLNDYQNVALRMADWSAVEDLASVTVFDKAFATVDEFVRALHPFAILCVMRERQPFDRALLQRMPNLRCIVSTGQGNRAIDLDAAAQCGVLVCGTELGPSREATAELAFGLLLAAARPILQEDRAIRAGGWQVGLGTLVHGKTLGILGLGGIGRMVARMGQAFGMRIIAWSQNLDGDAARACGVEAVGRDELFARSDFLSVHVLLSDRTRGLVGARELALMKPTAVLVNTARGAIVDEPALIDALRSGRIACAALDTFEQEPLPADHALRSLPNTILTPHIGYASRETYEIYFRGTVEAVLGYCRGAPIRPLNQPRPADGR
jgi:phosphoglycerate dehydrogenase-like enzyme